MRLFLRFSPLFISILLGGCSFLEIDQDVSTNSQTQWKAPKKALPTKSGQYTQGYDGQPLDLYGLFDISVRNSPMNRRAWQQAREAASLYGEARTLYLPSGGVTSGIYRQKNKHALPGIDGYQTIAGTTLQMTWLIFDFGGREASIRAAKDAMYASNFDFNQSLQDLALNVEIAYFNLNSAQAATQSNWSSMRDAYMALVAAEEKERSGLGDIQDVLRARANYQGAIYNLEKSGAEVEQARANLATIAGLRISASVDIVPPKPPEDMDVVGQGVEELLAESMKARPTLLAAYSQTRAKQSEVKAAQSALLPSIFAGGTAQYTEGVSKSLTSEQQYSIGVGLQWDIFDLFTDHFKLLGARAQAKQSLENLRQTELEVMGQVWSYYYGFKSSIQQVNSARALVASSQEAFEAVRIGYATGINNLLDLLDAQDTLASSRLTLVEAESTFHTSLVNLVHSTGLLTVHTRPEPTTDAS